MFRVMTFCIRLLSRSFNLGNRSTIANKNLLTTKNTNNHPRRSSSSSRSYHKKPIMFKYPEPRRDESNVETIFGKEVHDPYRWLEDPNADETKQFVNAQNEVSRPYIESCCVREKINRILTNDFNYKRIGSPFKRGNHYYFYQNTGLQPQSVLYQQDTIDSEPRVFFDPNTLSADGLISMTVSSFSHSGEYFAYGLSFGGSDWLEIRIMNVKTGEELPDKLQKARSTSMEWSHDDKGFFYCSFPSHKDNPNGTDSDKVEFHSVYYHTLNTEQSKDVLKVDFPDHPLRLVGCEVSEDGKQLHFFGRQGCLNNNWYYCPIADPGAPGKLNLIPIHEELDSKIHYVGGDDEFAYAVTNLDAPNCRLVKVDLANPSRNNWIDIIPNHELDVLNWAEIYTHNGQDYLLVKFLSNVKDVLELRKLEDGSLVKKFNLQPGTVSKQNGHRTDGEFFFHFTSFLSPGQIYHFDFNKMNEDPKMIRESRPNNFTPDDYKIDQVVYTSKDGVKVPMFIVSRKDLVQDGSNPCVLYGYGGFGISVTSAFSIKRISWLKNFKGVFAVANIRGGSEFGQNWHDSGRMLNKQNCFHDFICAAEYLIDNKYTRRDKLAIEGGSNGGLLVAAVSNMRPDLFGASLCHVGVLDMLRFHKFTIGHAWTTDYGDPSEKDDFENVIKFSPYHNVPEQATTYPATLLLTADHDDRVVPAHSLKFIAQLQHKLGKKLSDVPLLIRVDVKSGHGGGKPVTKMIEESTDVYSFLCKALNLDSHFVDDPQ